MARNWEEAQRRELAFWRAIYADGVRDIPSYTPVTDARALAFTAKTLERFDVSWPELKAARLLDLGSGPYGLVKGLSALAGVERMYALDPLMPGYKAFGTFPTDSRLSLLAARGESLPLGDSSIDWTFTINVLDHVENPERVLTEAARVTRADGVVCVAAHAVFGPWRSAAPALKYIDANHPHHFTVDRLQGLCMDAFRDVRITRVVGVFEDHPEFTAARAMLGPQRLRSLKRFFSRGLLQTVYLRCASPIKAVTPRHA